MDRPARSTTAALTSAIIVGTAAFGAGILGTLGLASGAMRSGSDAVLMVIGLAGLALVAFASVVLLRLTRKAASEDG